MDGCLLRFLEVYVPGKLPSLDLHYNTSTTTLSTFLVEMKICYVSVSLSYFNLLFNQSILVNLVPAAAVKQVV